MIYGARLAKTAGIVLVVLLFLTAVGYAKPACNCHCGHVHWEDGVKPSDAIKYDARAIVREKVLDENGEPKRDSDGNLILIEHSFDLPKEQETDLKVYCVPTIHDVIFKVENMRDKDLHVCKIGDPKPCYAVLEEVSLPAVDVSGAGSGEVALARLDTSLCLGVWEGTWTPPDGTEPGEPKPGVYHFKMKGEIEDLALEHMPEDGGESLGSHEGSKDAENVNLATHDAKITLVKVDLDVFGVADNKEETEGKVVVRRHDDNKASRKKIILQKVLPVSWTGQVVLSRNNKKVKVFDSRTKGNEISFNGTDNVFDNKNLPKTLWVQGHAESKNMLDVSLDLTSKGPPICKDIVRFTVLWVSKITGKTSGKVSPTDHNQARPTIVSSYFEELGVWTKGSDRYGLGIELKGEVQPSDFDKNVILDRDGAYKYYKDKKNGSKFWKKRDFRNKIPPGNDRGPSTFRDDDPQSGKSKGDIYDWDAPGIAFWSFSVGTIVRARSNMKEFAVFRDDGIEVRCSLIYKWYCVRSGKKTGKNKEDWTKETSISGDNKVVFGSHAKMTWDLK